MPAGGVWTILGAVACGFLISENLIRRVADRRFWGLYIALNTLERIAQEEDRKSQALWAARSLEFVRLAAFPPRGFNYLSIPPAKAFESIFADQEGPQ